MHFKLPKFLSLCLLGILIWTGFQLSERKLLWIDELFTQEQTIDKHTYKDILFLKFPEGNKNPLFYIIQKSVSDITNFRFPPADSECDYTKNPRRHSLNGQVILRFPTNLYMSLAIVLIFYFFSKYFSIWTGIYSLAIALSTPMVWMFWVEARPYSLWFLLTTIQILILWSTILDKKESNLRGWGLIIIHFLLSLTTVASILQIAIVSFLIWHKKIYKKYQILVLLPVFICIFYNLAVPLIKIKTFLFWFILFNNVMPERLCVYLLYGLVFWKIPEKLFFLKTFTLFLISACSVLMLHYFTPSDSFGFYNRYLIYLVPIDIMMFTIASHDFIKLTLNKKLVLMNVLIILISLLIFRGLSTYVAILASGVYQHRPG